MKYFLGNQPVSVAVYEPYKINNGEVITATANTDIQFGDSVYIIDNNVYQAANGEYSNLPFGTKIGYTVNSATNGGTIKVRTIGEVAVDYDISVQLAAQDELIAQINTALE